MTLNQVGRFSLPRRLIDLEPEAVMELMKFMLVVRAEFLFAENKIDYTAISDRFEEVPPEVQPPTYQLIEVWLEGKPHLALEREGTNATN